MSHYLTFSTRIACPTAEAFAWHERPGALQRLTPPWVRMELLEQSGGIQTGGTVKLRQKVGPFRCDWHVEHRGYIAGEQFQDVQVAGPFAVWEHMHRFEPAGVDACWLHDGIEWALPGGVAGNLILGRYVRAEVERLFRWRHAVTKADLESAPRGPAARARRVLVAGASGLIGSSLVPFLRTQGHEVFRLVRRKVKQADEIFWNPAEGALRVAEVEGVDAVIHLAGENLAAGRWTPERRRSIRASRVETTRTLVETVARLEKKPEVFISASGVGFYGDRGDEILTEESAIGRGFIADVCEAWEQPSRAAEVLGIRAVQMRLGAVLSPAGGALAKMVPAFRCGVGGPLGSGRQWMSWVSIDDVVVALGHALVDPRCAGPVNVASPGAVTNRDFARTLADVLGRPAWLRVPAVALRRGLGPLADEVLLASTRAVPARLAAAGFRFRYPELESALRHVLGRETKENLD